MGHDPVRARQMFIGVGGLDRWFIGPGMVLRQRGELEAEDEL